MGVSLLRIAQSLLTGRTIRALENLGKPQENYGDRLVPIVLEKLLCDI